MYFVLQWFSLVCEWFPLVLYLFPLVFQWFPLVFSTHIYGFIGSIMGFPWFSIGFYRFCKESGQVSLLWASPSSLFPLLRVIRRSGPLRPPLGFSFLPSSFLARNKEIWSSLASSGPLLPQSLSLRVMEGIERKEWPTPSPKRLRKALKTNRLGAV